MKKLFFTLILMISSLFLFSGNGDSVYANGTLKIKTIKTDLGYEVTKYYEQGNIQEVEYFSLEKERTGTWIRYSESGCVLAIANFKNDRKNGDWKIYNDCGKLIVYIKYKNGKKDVVCTLNENNEFAVK